MVSRQINDMGRQMRGRRRGLAILTIAMLLAPALALLLTTTQVEIVAASPGPENVAYDFKDNENNKAWEDADAALTLLTPPMVPDGSSEASPAEYTAISISDDSRWQTVGGALEYEFHYFKFKIFGTISEIDNFTVHWEGFSSPEDTHYFIWNSNDSSWELIYILPNRADDETIENTFTTDISHYIYENTGAGENQVWLAVRSQAADASCPTLYIWDGERYVSYGTASSAGGLGFPTPQGFYDSNPKSYEVLPDETIKIEDGFYRIALGEELDEICYQDMAKLYKVYHPIGTHVISGTVTHPLGPCTNNEIYLVRDLRPPSMAIYENGENILPLISDIDGRATSGVMGEFDRIILDLGDLSQAKQIKLVVKMYTGWLNEFTMESSYAEVVDENGNWVRVSERVDSLPEYTKHPQDKLLAIDITDWFLTDNYWLRLNDFHNKHWDFIGVDISSDEILAWRELNLATADLYRKGQSVLHHDPIGDWWEFDRTFEVPSKYSGYFTRYGDVKPLLENSDDIYVIMLTGDAIELQFESRVNFLDLLVAFGLLEKTFVFESDGWYKEEWTKFLVGENVCKVEPLPFHAMSYYPYPNDEEYPWTEKQVEWWDEYQTRRIEPDADSHNSLNTDYVKVNVYVTTIKPTQPTLYLPSDGDNLIDNTPYFEWTKGENTTSHRLLVDNDSDFSSTQENRIFTTENCYTPASENSFPDENYSWKVVAINENGENESLTWTFVISPIWITPPSVESVCGQNAGHENIYTIDDNIASYWSCPSTHAHEIVFDMERVYNIRKIRLYQQAGAVYRWGQATGLTVYVSENTTDWGDNVWEGALNASGWQENGNSFLKEGRYVKLVSKSTVNLQRMFEFDACVAPPLPTQPILHLPADGSAAPPYFEWENGIYADNHRLLVDNDSDFSSPEENRIILNDNKYTIAYENVLPDDNYSWKVIAYNENGETPSTVWTFQVFELFYPENSSIIVDRTPKFLWNEITGVTFYWLYLDNDSDLDDNSILKTKVYENYYQIPWSGFVVNGTWYWKVIASDSSTTSVFNFVENGAEVTTGNIENITETSGDLLANIILNALDDFDIRFRYKSEYQYQTEGDTFIIQDYNVPDPPTLPAWRQENVLIAASDSSQEAKDAADNVCPGPNENEVWYDEDTIQAAMAENTTIYLFDGTYYCGSDTSAEIIITTSRLSLIGESKENVIIRWKPLAYYEPSAIRINAENAENFLFENFTLGGPGRTFAGEFSGLHVHSPGNLNGSIHDVVMRNIRVENFSAMGIYFERSATEIYDPPRTQTLYNCWAINCEVNEVGCFGIDAGGYVADSSAVHVWNIYFDNIKVSNVLGSPSYNQAGGAHLHRLENSMIVNCTFENIGGAGITLSGTGHPSKVQILGNKFERCGLTKPLEGAGLNIYGSSLDPNEPAHRNIRIEGNDFDTFWGFRISDVKTENLVIVNNSLYNCVEPFRELQEWDSRESDIENNTAPNFENFTPWENDYADTAYSYSLTGLDSGTHYGIIAETENNGDDSWGKANYFVTLGAENLDLSEPENDSSTSLKPTFKWSDIKTRSYYTLQVDTSDNFDNTNVIDLNLMENEYTPVADLDNNTQHWWRVTVYPPEQTSEVWIFTTAPPEWRHVENWTGTIKAFATWELIMTWTGILDAFAEWDLIENWSGTAEAFAQWNSIENWSGTVEAFATWNLIENWAGTIQPPVAWQLIETWSGTIEAFAEWNLIETWTGTIEAFAEWNSIENWTGTIEAYAEWNLIEEWAGTLKHKLATVATESATSIGQTFATLNALVTYGSYENVDIRFQYRVDGTSTWENATWENDYTAILYSDTVFGLSAGTTYEFRGQIEFGAFSDNGAVLEFTTQALAPDWELIETWTGEIETQVQWNLEETWAGTVDTQVAWNLIETWTGTIESLPSWLSLESWAGTIEAYVAPEEEEPSPSGPGEEEPEDEEPTPTMIPLSIAAVWVVFLAVLAIWVWAHRTGPEKRRWARDISKWIVPVAAILTFAVIHTENVLLTPIMKVIGTWIIIFVLVIFRLSSVEPGPQRVRWAKQFFCVLITLIFLTLLYLKII